MIFMDTPRPTSHRRFETTAHLLSDISGAQGTVELVRFARALGLRSRWIQNVGTPTEHFDLFDGAINAAIARGAQLVEPRELVELVVRPKRGLQAPLRPWVVADTPNSAADPSERSLLVAARGSAAAIAVWRRSFGDSDAAVCVSLARWQWGDVPEPKPDAEGAWWPAERTARGEQWRGYGFHADDDAICEECGETVWHELLVEVDGWPICSDCRAEGRPAQLRLPQGGR